MSRYAVEVTRTVELVVEADDHESAAEAALEQAWLWQPPNAHGDDQGTARALVLCVDSL